MRTLVAGILLVLWTLPSAEASWFGQNKVRYRDLDWRVIETAHFLIHYYEEEEELALETVPLAEAIYEDLAARLDHEIPRPVPLVIYGSHPDFQKTSISPFLIDEGTGGVTEFLKRRVILPYPGSREEYRHVLHHELVHAFQIDILDPDGRRPVTAERIPLWMIEGMAEYISRDGEDPTTRMWVRDALLDGSPPDFHTLSQMGDVRIYRFGQSVWAFLADRYGEEKAGEFLHAVAAGGTAETAVRTVFRLDFDELTDQWHDQIRAEHYPRFPELERAGRLGDLVAAEGRVNVAPEISPDGSRVAFLSDRGGRISLYLAGTDDGDEEEERLLSGGASSDLESLRPYHGGPRFSPDGRFLLFPAQAGEGEALHLFDLEENRIVRTLRPGLLEVRGLCWSPDGREVIVAGLAGGKTDLYRCSVETGETTRITSDRFVYLHPDWSRCGRKIVCATDRVSSGSARADGRSLRLAVLDLESGEWTILPGQEGNNHSPAWGGDGDRIAFVSDRGGTPDLYLLSTLHGGVSRVTMLDGGVAGLLPDSRALSWSAESGRICFSAFRRQSWSVVLIDDPGPVDPDPSLWGPERPVETVALGAPAEGAEAAFLPPYRILPYRARLTSDVRATGASAGPDGSFASASSIAFSDILGEQRMELLFGIYGSLRNSDLLVAYQNLTRRTGYETALFNFRRVFYDRDGRVYDRIYRGATVRFTYPLDRFRRFEYGLSAGEGNDEVFRDLADGASTFFVGARAAFVHDNVRWGRTGARGGRRSRLSMEPVYSDRPGGWLRADGRAYFPAGDRVVLASRTVAGLMAGSGGPVLRYGYRNLVRGFPDVAEEERGYAAQSLEIRFPLVDLLALGWPFPIAFGGIRGVLFADGGYFDGEPAPRISWGTGARMYFGPFQLMLDFPAMYRGSDRTGTVRGLFRIGREF